MKKKSASTKISKAAPLESVENQLYTVELSKKIIEHLPLGIFILNQAGEIEYVNQAMLDISATPKENMIGFNLITSPTYEKIGIGKLISRAIKEKKSFKTDIIKYVSLFGKKESDRIFTCIPLLTSDGRFEKLILTIEDLTEIRKKTEELERFNKLMVGRELRMIELKAEVARLKDLYNKCKNHENAKD